MSMSVGIEPPMKKIKMILEDNDFMMKAIDKCIEDIDNSKKNLEPVLGEEFGESLQLVKVFVGITKDPKDLSKTVITLNEKVPLKQLQHLKRVRKKQVILCPASYIIGVSSIQQFIESTVMELKDSFQYFKEMDVPLTAPKIQKQFKEYNKIWSCNFHPNAYSEKLMSGDFFSSVELNYHRSYMKMAFEVSRWYIQHTNITIDIEDVHRYINGAVVVDPTIQSVVAVAFDNRDNNPIQHAAMLAIDNVAKTQNGGVWFEMEYKSSNTHSVSNELLTYLKLKFPSVKFGSREYIGKRDSTSDESKKNSNDTPYLCTGYYVYLIREPCFMCSMALVHARAKRIFFCLDNVYFGALKSKTKLQTKSSLNHHFEVFTGFL